MAGSPIVHLATPGKLAYPPILVRWCMAIMGASLRCVQVEEEFVAAIRGQGSIRRTTFEQGVRYMEFTEAVTRSMQNGCTVKLPLLG